MSFVARLHPATASPLQGVCYGNSPEALRRWAATVLKTAPSGAVVDVYEEVEVLIVQYTLSKEGDPNELLETPAADVTVYRNAGTKPTVTEFKKSRDAGAAGEKREG